MTARKLPPIDNFLRASPDEAEAEELIDTKKEAQDETKKSSLVYDPLSRFVFKYALYF